MTSLADFKSGVATFTKWLTGSKTETVTTASGDIPTLAGVNDAIFNNGIKTTTSTGTQGLAAALDDRATKADLSAGLTGGAPVYADTATGLSSTSQGDYFNVPSANSDESLILYRYDAGPVATLISTSPSTGYVDSIGSSQFYDRYKAVERHRSAQQNAFDASQKKAAVVILLGQSLNAAHQSPPVKYVANSSSYMMVGGAHVSDFQYWSSNQEFCTNYSDVASLSGFTEGTGQTPGVGVASTIVGDKYERCYVGSIAVGSRDIATIATGGIRCNLFAFCHRFAEMVRADGYVPEIMFYSAHGEADASAGTTETDYYAQAGIYYTMCQTAAAQAMQAPGYKAPVILTQPLQNAAGTNGEADRQIATAIARLGRDLPGAANIGGVYQWPANTDRVHPTEAGYVQRGEFVGQVLRNMMMHGEQWPGPYITDVSLNGSTFYVTFNTEVERDTSCIAGTSLNTSYALDGFEWLDNGSFIQIMNLQYNGRLVVGTLASAPTGTISQQILRIATQTTTATLTSGADYHSGSQVRASKGAITGIYNPAQISYFWADKQETGVRTA